MVLDGVIRGISVGVRPLSEEWILKDESEEVGIEPAMERYVALVTGGWGGGVY